MERSYFKKICVKLVLAYLNEWCDKPNDRKKLTENDVYFVLEAMTNDKALLTTSIDYGTYYAITYNKYDQEIYFETYKRDDLMCFGTEYCDIDVDKDLIIVPREKEGVEE